MQKLLQLLGFYGEDYENEDEYSDYEDERSRRKKSSRKDEPRGRVVPPKLVFFKGVPSEDIKLRLRDVLLDGTMILLDLRELEADRREDGLNFITFMGGVAYAHRGLMQQIGKSPLFIITPSEGMFQWWAGEE